MHGLPPECLFGICAPKTWRSLRKLRPICGAESDVRWT
jgi:hypothetical protein